MFGLRKRNAARFSFVGDPHLARMAVCTLCNTLVHNLMMEKHAREVHGFKGCGDHHRCVTVEPGPRRMTYDERKDVLGILRALDLREGYAGPKS